MHAHVKTIPTDGIFSKHVVIKKNIFGFRSNSWRTVYYFKPNFKKLSIHVPLFGLNSLRLVNDIVS